MESALLYTFSTIPQTVGAALAVLAAFVLYRLQSDSSTRWHDARELTNEFGMHHPTAKANPATTLGDLVGRQRYKDLLEELNALYAGREWEAWDTKRLAHLRLTASLDARDKIQGALWWAFLATATAIVGSVIVLTVSHQIANSHWSVGAAVLALGVFSLTLCLCLYWLVIEASLWTE